MVEVLVDARARDDGGGSGGMWTLAQTFRFGTVVSGADQGVQGGTEDVHAEGGRQRDAGAVYMLWVEPQCAERGSGLGVRALVRRGEQEGMNGVESTEDRVGEA